MEEKSVSESIFSVLNELFSKLFSSVDNSIYTILDDITFINTDIISGNNFQKIFGESNTNGILLICNSLVFGCILFFSINYLISHFTLGKSQNPMQFILKGIIFIAVMNSSIWVCSEIINIVSIISKFILDLGESMFNSKISFSSFIKLINENIYNSNKEFNIFSFEGVVKSFTSFGFVNLVFTYSLRYILIQVFVLISPFAFLSLTLDKTEWFFKTWIKLFISLLLEQILIAIILILAFSIDSTKNYNFTQLLYIGIIYALMRANVYMRQIFGGLYTTVSATSIG